ncbi:hypothetical protein FPSE_04161 [Fusarium pseudograminearum CS3096]|uniref:Zn(2)-C6 fungal-type domain-containing protein n=1 Tax=Fusarium pseudograminearum (strain CS3096) TaxID=1028729 RepID=K3W1C5_FUSPC|nr:hypothetical protein FPSE_04161 [Fusarium pseudograminearum CS3096]EKJ75660.1 hypothetical protein FPSE_04161 [Fusarium pseudograminearum CS3096]
MVTSPTPTSPDFPDTNTPSQKGPASRACDRCRRRKARCVLRDLDDRCNSCRESGARCTFDLPISRRGPKARTRKSRSQGRGQGQTGENSTTELTASASNDSSAGWDSSAVHLGLSPSLMVSPVSVSVSSDATTSQQRWQDLSGALAFITNDLHHFVTQCFDLFFEYLYPLTPLVHEPSLRDSLSYFTQFPIARGTGLLELWPETTFTLITAVCAEAAFLLPKDLFPEGQSVADIFLNASRACLNQFLEAELESPNANSITIRYFHSNCLHAAGKPKYSWHIFGEATRLAQVMQLNLETSLEGLQPVEAELRRRAFWIVYMGDKSAAILNNRPITIHKFSFEAGITTAYPSGIEDEAPVLSPGNLVTNSDVVRITCIEGFNANLRLWQNASDLLLELRLMHDRGHQDLGMTNLQSLLGAQDKDRLDELYIRFITCLDDLPPYLQSYTFAALVDGSRETAKQFLIQCANLQVSIHCLRMVITQKLENLPFYKAEMGHSDLRKTEIARDMLRVIQEAPFWSLQVNGEPYLVNPLQLGRKDKTYWSKSFGDYTQKWVLAHRYESPERFYSPARSPYSARFQGF